MNAATQCVWLQDILRELNVALDSPTVIWCDNQSTINISIDPVQRQRTKHIEIHMHYIRGFVHDRVIALQYCPSTKQTVGIFTKCFIEKTFTYLRSLPGVSDTWWWIPFTFIFFPPCPFFRRGFVPMWFSSFPFFYGKITFFVVWGDFSLCFQGLHDIFG